MDGANSTDAQESGPPCRRDRVRDPSRWGPSVLDWLLPPTCALCGAAGLPGLDLCPGCLADLPHNCAACPRCALPLPPDQAVGATCGRCQRHPPPFDAAHAAFRYEGPLPALVAGAKFRGRMNLMRLLGSCLLRALLEQGAARPELIVPVPLHPARLRERGYNQALEIARVPARALGLPIDARGCARVRATAPQMGLERAARRLNVRGAFQVTAPPAARHVALVDDVVTTGQTAAELARALRRAGVARVDLWAVARTP
ncbi:ComF family protein [Thiococcus pfennigii]|uniref:ComF family protein n=1 Tax=Thiococcus pfennigii TaxID=1057 RepID=UPI001F5B38AE|nr:ComF family protein [Thiococcus pfennigii]